MNINISLILAWFFIGAAVTLLAFVILHAIFLVYGFTMTPELKKEEIAVKMCIIFNLTDTTCNDLYGGIGPKIGGKH